MIMTALPRGTRDRARSAAEGTRTQPWLTAWPNTAEAGQRGKHEGSPGRGARAGGALGHRPGAQAAAGVKDGQPVGGEVDVDLIGGVGSLQPAAAEIDPAGGPVRPGG